MSKAVDYFWTWFIDNQAKIKTLRTLQPKEQKHYTFWLDWHLHFYAPGLDYIIIFPKREDDAAQLIVTANGDPEYYAKAESIVASAPHFKGWQFTAFVQPKHSYEDLEAGLDAPYVFQDITLKTSDLKFIPFDYDGEKKIDMIIYLKNYTVYSKNDKLLQFIFIIMQDLLGEKILYENINFVELAQMPNSNGNWVCLYDLQLYLDEINSKQQKKNKDIQ